MNATKTIESTIRLLNEIGMKSASRNIRLRLDPYKKMISIALSKEIKKALEDAGLNSNKAVVGSIILLISNNSIPNQGEYRITAFNSENFTPIGHFHYPTIKDAVTHFKKIIHTYSNSPDEIMDILPDIDGSDGVYMSTLASFSDVDKETIYRKLAPILSKSVSS